jgi:hypothetical protein
LFTTPFLSPFLPFGNPTPLLIPKHIIHCKI